ncbi:sigma-70 family RNA polymerase sigma factor [Nocardioides cavernaquae]|uniref:RNA polymerase sigma factor n=1 Tax=Nocardioides cavernaquae TaxID=2321396 RepID=A0A3A5HFQ0_9ACTN|nr:sigma-70 family RNA polymerase sigma factor [Nocardioides cavernaquae]RJS46864.1 sigma-70 family RNA polymerase sigma factor [Nocardioides cavernaquae]
MADPTSRDELLDQHLPLVQRCAWRFRDRGEPLEDLVQVGTIGLIHAIDRYDAERGVPFVGYAIPTIVGEMRRHLRDRASTVRLPRDVHELRPRALAAAAALAQEFGRTPRVDEVAERLAAPRRRVATALDPQSTVPIDEGVDGEVTDGGFEDVELRTDLHAHLAVMPPTERTVLVLRFLQELTQEQVATELGISQMQVSRVQARALARLRHRLSRT